MCPVDAVMKVLRDDREKHPALRNPIPVKLSPPLDNTERPQSIGGSTFVFAGIDGATSLKAELVGRVPVLKDASSYREARRLLQEELGGIHALREELARASLVERATNTLTTGTRPFNVFARLAAGAMKQDDLEQDQELLGEYRDKFLVCANLPANDEHWDSDEPEWVGRASMSQRHCFLTSRNLHWSVFNALSFGLVSPEDGGITREAAIKMLEEMKEAALKYAEGKGAWSKRIGLYLHVFGHCSVSSLHLHVVDLAAVGPTFQKLAYKNCPVDDIIKVLKEELAVSSSQLILKQVSESAHAAAHAAQEVLDAAEALDLNAGGERVTVERGTLLQATTRNSLDALPPKRIFSKDLCKMRYKLKVVDRPQDYQSVDPASRKESMVSTQSRPTQMGAEQVHLGTGSLSFGSLASVECSSHATD